MTNEHPYREEDFELYALGVLEGDELRRIETHMNSCADCSQKIAEARGRIALLAFSAEPAEPSLEVRQRLMARIRAEADPARATVTERTERAPSSFWNFAWGTLALALAIFAVYLWNSNKVLQQELDRQEAAMKTQVALTEKERAIVALFSSPKTVTVNLAAKAPNATEPGRVVYNAQQGALVYVGTLPQLAADKSYELWVIPQTGNPIPAGVFSAEPSGEAKVVLPNIPAGISPKAFAVTIEPAGGGATPTGPFAQVGATP
ncbi:MAG TPA: anti-sigma factor [Candidatus Acidoferrales bacterium]